MLYEATKDRVYSIALYFFHGDSAAASDATQQVFLKLITGIGQFRGDAQFSTWLYRLVRNTCMDSARQSKARERREEPVEVSRLEVGRVGPSSQEELERCERARSIQTAVSALPPPFRLAILMRHFEEMSYEEMAGALGCSLGTVASRLSRGHRMLQRWFASRGHDV